MQKENRFLADESNEPVEEALRRRRFFINSRFLLQSTGERQFWQALQNITVHEEKHISH